MRIFGISVDPVESHARFKAELKLPFSLLSDAGRVAIRRFDAVMPREGGDLAARKIVLIDRAGTVVYRDEAYDLTTGDDYRALRAAVGKLE